MLKMVFVLILTLIPWASQAQGVTYEQTVVLQNNALIDRLNIILSDRLQLLSNCEDGGFKKTALQLNDYLNQMPLDHASVVSHQPELLNSLLNALRASKVLEKNCLGTSEIKSIKKPFIFSGNSENKKNPLNRLWWKTLEPACYKIRLKGELHNVDGNACFAGDRVIIKEFEYQKVDLINSSLRYSYSLLTDLANTPPGGEFKLEDSYFNEFNSNNPELLISIITAIGSSGPSGLTGWLQGLEDRLLVRDLNKKISNEQILQHFTDLQTAKFNYVSFRDTVDKYKVTLKLYGQDVNSWNRHNMMAAFLGCSLRYSFREKTPTLIYLTGVAYETKDFFSHLKEGVSLKASERNFVEDTTRYKVSGQFGYNLCPN